NRGGDATFTESADAWGLGSSTAAFTGFGTAFFDFDNDGWLDLFIADGAVFNIEQQRGQPYPLAEKNLLFHNEAGRRFEEGPRRAAAASERLEVSGGAAFGDVDNDGTVDVLVTNNNGPARLYLNQTPPRAWLDVRLQGGPGENSAGVGARVGLVRKGKPALWRRVHTDGSYLSASDVRVHFGLGDDASVDALLVDSPR